MGTLSLGGQAGQDLGFAGACRTASGRLWFGGTGLPEARRQAGNQVAAGGRSFLGHGSAGCPRGLDAPAITGLPAF